MNGKYGVSVAMRSPEGRYIVQFPARHATDTVGSYYSVVKGRTDFFIRYGKDEIGWNFQAKDEIGWNFQAPRELRRLARKAIKEYDRRVATVEHSIKVEFVDMFGQFALVEAYLNELDYSNEAVRTLWRQCYDHIDNEYGCNFLSADWNEYVRSAD